MQTLRQLRQSKFEKQVDFAKAMNTSKSTVCGWENGQREPSIRQIIQMADLLGVSRYEIFDIFAANKNDLAQGQVAKDLQIF
ncbi:MAG: helix-turn-helix domain-containing protein [Firmicutes bacterium]|nr:helix-turn-helix domain-containing protein [Bacillota bacterium]